MLLIHKHEHGSKIGMGVSVSEVNSIAATVIIFKYTEL